MLLPLLAAVALADETRLDLSGSVVDDGIDHVLVPFEVPAGVAEVQVIHTTLTGEGTILDWGLFDPERFRGYGGGNPEDAIVSAQAASRSYLAGPIPAGTWFVEIGKAKLPTGAADYRLEVVLRNTQTLAPQPARTAYVPAAPLADGPRWIAADLHVHSRESGDAGASIDDIATCAA